jgi:uncharacterized protein (DUF433 family)
MSIVIAPEPVPLRETEEGVLRVGNSRVLLEILYERYQMGLSAEELHDQFPTAELADVHAVISFCLRHPEFIEAYMAAYERGAEEVKQKLIDAGMAVFINLPPEDDAQTPR